MTRPLRLQFPGSLCHVTAVGNNRGPTFRDDRDRRKFLTFLGEAVERYGWILTAYVLMPNRYHLQIELTEDSLSPGMQWLNGVYGQWFNFVHDRVGHLVQARFESIFIEKSSYFVETLMDVVLNPVREKLVRRPEDYEWSSYRATLGMCDAPDWLSVDDALAPFGDSKTARVRFKAFVEAGMRSPRRPWDDVVGKIFLGGRAFRQQMRALVESKLRSSEHVRAQRNVGRPDMAAIISAVASCLGVPEERIRGGHFGIPRRLAAWIGRKEGMLTNRSIANGLRLRTPSHVSRLISECDRELSRDAMLRECLDRCVSTLRGKEAPRKDLTPSTG